MSSLGCRSTYFRISIYYRMPNSGTALGRCSGKIYSNNLLKFPEKNQGQLPSFVKLQANSLKFTTSGTPSRILFLSIVQTA